MAIFLIIARTILEIKSRATVGYVLIPIEFKPNAHTPIHHYIAIDHRKSTKNVVLDPCSHWIEFREIVVILYPAVEFNMHLFKTKQPTLNYVHVRLRVKTESSSIILYGTEGNILKMILRNAI